MPKQTKPPGSTYGQRDLIRQERQRQLRGDPPADVDHWRPKSRSECQDGPRPCPFVGCKFHLFLDITPRGGLRVPHGEEPEALFELKETCALDVADRGGLTLEAVARLQSITRERVRQIELGALEKYKAAVKRFEEEAKASRRENSDKAMRHSAHTRRRERPDLASFVDITETDAEEEGGAQQQEGDSPDPQKQEHQPPGRAGAVQVVLGQAGHDQGHQRPPGRP